MPHADPHSLPTPPTQTGEDATNGENATEAEDATACEDATGGEGATGGEALTSRGSDQAYGFDHTDGPDRNDGPDPADGAGRVGPWRSRFALRGRDPRGAVGLCLSGAGLVCFLLVALLGPSVMEPALPGAPGEPPYSLVAHPSPYLVIALTAAGVVLAAAGLALCLLAVRAGWRFRPRLLLIAGVIATAAFALMPPVGSSDHLNYAAYGRMAITGNDPYATTARQLPADPVTRAVQDWRDTPTVYGPVATAQQTLASLIGGTSVRLTVFVMSLTNALAFLVTGLLLYRTARGDPGRELRAALLWTANPLLLFELVGGAHNDVLAIAFAVAGLVVFALPVPTAGRTLGRCVLTGLLIGAGAAVKVNVAIAGGGPALVLIAEWWRGRAHERQGLPKAAARLGALAVSAAVIAGLAYLVAGPHSLDQLSRASKSVSLATPWHLLAGAGGGLIVTVSRHTVQLGSALLTLLLTVLLLRALPGPDRDHGQDQNQDGGETFRITAALALAWLFAAPYALPWYDGLGWAAIALLAWSAFDWLLLARTSVLALAYLPARDPRLAGLPHGLDWLVTVVRAKITPWALTLTLMALIAAAVLRSRRDRSPGCSPRAPAGSPP
ncbi:MAG: polyprenol phosphomannose-dependent alpha 1,6 mannosyltransferase MptB [Actinoallomurus sp.]